MHHIFHSQSSPPSATFRAYSTILFQSFYSQDCFKDWSHKFIYPKQINDKMTTQCRSNFSVNEPALVSPTRSCDATSSRMLACLSSMKRSPTHYAVPYCVDDVYKIEEAANRSRLVAQMALAQIRIARAQQALALSRYPFLLSSTEQPNQILFGNAIKNSGLNALEAAAWIQNKNLYQHSSSGKHCDYWRQSSNSTTSSAGNASVNSAENIDNSINQESYNRTYVEKVGMDDILCGRGGRSNHHVGNKRYRLVVAKMKYMYRKCAAKTMKTDVSRAIVQHCTSYGARFLKLNGSNGKYYILSEREARKKTSQALREAKVMKWVN